MSKQVIPVVGWIILGLISTLVIFIILFQIISPDLKQQIGLMIANVISAISPTLGEIMKRTVETFL